MTDQNVCHGEWTEEVGHDENEKVIIEENYCPLRDKCRRFKESRLQFKTFYDVVPWKTYKDTGNCPKFEKWIFSHEPKPTNTHMV